MSDDSINVRIKSNVQNSNGSNNNDLTITIPSSCTVHQLKEEIRSSCFNSNNSNSSDSNDKKYIEDAPPISKDRYLRLICSGRLLAPDSTNISEFKCIKEGTVIHAILAAPGIKGGQQAALSRDSTFNSIIGGNGGVSRRNRFQREHRGIGIGSNGLIIPRSGNSDEDDDDDEGDIEEGRQRLGFDRLRSNGMSRSEIVALRAYFSRNVDRYIEQRDQINNEDTNTGNNIDTSTGNNNVSANSSDPTEDPRIYRLRMEDEWMNTQGPYSEFRLNTNISTQMNNNPVIRSRTYINGLEIDANTREITRDFRTGNGSSIIGALGTNRDLVWGIVLGYSFGFMTMFIIWLPTVPHKQRVGILCGFCFHMMMRILEQQQQQQQQQLV